MPDLKPTNESFDDAQARVHAKYHETCEQESDSGDDWVDYSTVEELKGFLELIDNVRREHEIRARKASTLEQAIRRRLSDASVHGEVAEGQSEMKAGLSR